MFLDMAEQYGHTISEAEWESIMEDFRRADRDRSGFVDRSEIERMLTGESVLAQIKSFVEVVTPEEDMIDSFMEIFDNEGEPD